MGRKKQLSLKKLERWLKKLKVTPMDLEYRSMLEPIPPDIFKFKRRRLRVSYCKIRK
ncbi:MAG: hypothetical protein QXI58_01895 [Candidatus Micrarchaeia archaeon]